MEVVGLAVVGPTEVGWVDADWGVGMDDVGLAGSAGFGVGIDVVGLAVGFEVLGSVVVEIGFCEVEGTVGFEVLGPVVVEIGFCEVGGAVGFEVLGPLVIEVGFCEVMVGVGRFVTVGVGTAVGASVGDVGRDVDGPGVGPCNLRLMDFVSEVLPASAEDSSVLSKTSAFSVCFTEQGLLSLAQACWELIESGAYPSFEHMPSSEMH